MAFKDVVVPSAEPAYYDPSADPEVKFAEPALYDPSADPEVKKQPFKMPPVQLDEQANAQPGSVMYGEGEGVTATPQPAPTRIPGQEALATSRNVGAGVLKIAPTAVKGVVDIADMATGGKIESLRLASKDIDERMKVIDHMVGTDKFNQQQADFARILADDSKGLGDMFGYMIDNPSLIADQSITTIGSMFLPAGVAGKAGKIAKAMTGSTAAAEKAVIAASVGTSALQNAADTFSALEGKDTAERYKGAAISALLSGLVGKFTEGGAEANIVRRLMADVKVGKSLDEAEGFLKGLGKAVGKETGQEVGEEVGNVLGETAGGNEISANAAGKRVALSGALGGVLGGGGHVATARPGSPEAAAAEYAQAQAEHKAAAMFSGMRSGAATTAPAATPLGNPPVDTTGINPLTLEPEAQAQPAGTPAGSAAAPGGFLYTGRPIQESAATGQGTMAPPASLQTVEPGAPIPTPQTALPAPGQVAIRTAPTMEPTEVPVATPGEQNAARVYAARAAEEARQAQLTASQVPIDPADPMTSIRSIAAAPVTPVGASALAGTTAAPAGIDQAKHGEIANTVAQNMLDLAHLTRAMSKAEGPKERAAIKAQIATLRADTQQMKDGYASQYGAPAAAHMTQLAAETFHTLKGDYRSLVKPATAPAAAAPAAAPAAAEATAAVTPAAQPVGEQNASAIRSNAGQVRQGGEGGQPGVQRGAVEGGGNLQLEAPQQANVGSAPGGSAAQEGARQQPVAVPALPANASPVSAVTGTGVPTSGTVEPKAGTTGVALSPQRQLRHDALMKEWNDPKAKRSYDAIAADLTKLVNEQRAEDSTNVSKTAAAEKSSGITAGIPSLSKGLIEISKNDRAELDRDKVLWQMSGWKGERRYKPAYHENVKRSSHMIETSELGEHEELVTRKATDKIDRGLPMPARQLRKYEQQVVAAVIKDALDLGLNPAVLYGLTGYHSYIPGSRNENAHHAAWDGESRTIGFNEELLALAAEGHDLAAKTLLTVFLHEVGHEVDLIGKGRARMYSSTFSPMFEVNAFRATVGEIAREARDAYKSGSKEIRELLEYPFDRLENPKQHGVSVAAVVEEFPLELFAQLHTMFYVQPAAMKKDMPKAYKLMGEIKNAIDENTRNADREDQPDRARFALQSTLRARRTGNGVQRTNAIGTGTEVPGRTGSEQAKPGVGENGGVQLKSEKAGGNAQRDLTETPAFKKWFGNSEVVDANGNPLVVYHGSASEFSVFEMGEEGFHFGTSGQAGTMGGIVRPFFLSAQRMFKIKEDLQNWNDIEYVADYLLRKRYITKKEHDNFGGLQEWLESKGFDGYSYPNAFEGEGTSYAVLNPSQIKLAIGNSGKFDAGNLDIAKSRDTKSGERDLTDTPAFKKWFGDSKIVDANGNPMVVYHATGADISEFNPAKGKQATHTLNRSAFSWFSSKEFADMWANNVVLNRRMFTTHPALNTPEHLERSHARKNKANPAVYPVYLRMENPLDLSSRESGEAPSRSDIRAIANATGLSEQRMQSLVDDAVAEIEEDDVWASPDSVAASSIFGLLQQPFVEEALLRSNVDGIILQEHGEKTYGVKSPNQVKSAIGNSGAFDLGKLDIAQSREGELALPTPKLKTTLTPRTYVEYRQRAATSAKFSRQSVSNLAQHFNDLVKKKFGGPLDMTDPKNVKLAIRTGVNELKYQLTQARTGLDWYEADIGKAFKITEKHIPELKDPRHRQLFTVLAGVMSPTTKAHENWDNAATAYRAMLDTGTIPTHKPSGSVWSVLTGNVKVDAIRYMNAMLNDKAFGSTKDDRLTNVVNYLMAPHTVRELSEQKRKYGIFSENTKIDGKLEDKHLGAALFGPKVGPFVLNLSGIDTEVTVDVWMSRTYNRWAGNMFEIDRKTGKPEVNDKGEKVVAGAPRNEGERAIVKSIIEGIARETGYSNSQVQAVLWFFEQQLYRDLGVRGKEYYFSQGAERFAAKQGVRPAGGPGDVGSSGDLFGPATVAASIDVTRVATAQEFKSDPVTALQRPGWAVITATVGNDQSANSALEQELKDRGIDFEEVGGSYDGEDQGRSFLIYADESTAIELGHKYKQEAVIANRGYLYDDGRIAPAVHESTIIGPAALKEKGYTTLPDGTPVSMGLDFGNVTNDDMRATSSASDYTSTTGGPADRAKVVESKELAGDGRGFTDFFSAASRGERAPDVKTYKPVLDISGVKDFTKEYLKHRGNFDDHIATSIPGFREVQQLVGDAIVKSYPVHGRSSSATLLDIAASEGAFNKAITAESDTAIFTLALDPNLTMAKFFEEHSEVPGADYDVAAFGSKEDEGKTAWTEDDGTVIPFFKPIEKYDIVHESMGFQFISNTRNAQFARVKELMRPDGIALFEEKVKEDTPQWHANEAQKDAYKARYFTAKQMAAKKAEVLEKGEAGAAAAESAREQNIVGMNDLMTTSHEFETALTNNWKHVAQYWDSGNFKGYVASDSHEALNRFLSNLGDTNSEFSTIHTPAMVTKDVAPELDEGTKSSPEGELSLRRSVDEAYYGNITPEQRDALKNIGAIKTKKTVAQHWQGMTQNVGVRLHQGVVDQFAPIKALDEKAYLLARLSKGSDGALEAMMTFGNLKLLDGVTDSDARGIGIIEHLQALRGEHHRFMVWVAAHRADQLTREGRENLFGKTDIEALKKLADNDADFPNRKAQYMVALAHYNAASRNVLDIAEQSGIIDGASRKLWEKEFYVPFYRAMEAGESPNFSGNPGLVRQYAFKKLKGGKEKLNQDLLANVLMNWSHLLTASAKNRAAQATLKAAEQQMVAVQLPEAQAPKGSVFYLENGKKVWYEVHDPFILDAITSLEAGIVGGYAGKVLGKLKNAITIGVTANPVFKVRNLIRDSVQSIALSNQLSVNILGNVYKGTKAIASRKSQTYASMLAGGGLIRFGSMLEGNRSSHVSKLVNSGVKDSTILDSKEKVKDFMQKSWDYYNNLGDISEGANRASLYEQMRKAGKSHAEASLAARDLLDFSKGGSFGAVRFLVQTVPFMNARIQGLYRVGQAMKHNPARFAAVASVVALASIALMLGQGDDDDWKAREDWDRDNYWWFKLDGVAYRIPKPFEVGVIGTLAERSVEAFVSDEMTKARFIDRVRFAIMNTFAMNPAPQMFKPLIDIYANVDSFTGRRIESTAQLNLPKADRYGPRTSELAKGAAPVTGAVGKVFGVEGLSPAQIDHLVKGYFGWLGTMTLVGTDAMFRPMLGRPERPEGRLKEMFLVGSFAENLPASQSRYLTQFYDQAKEVNEAYAGYRQRVKEGNRAGAAEFRAENRALIAAEPRVAEVQRQLSELHAQEVKVRESDASPETKRTKLNLIEARRNTLAKRAAAMTAKAVD